MKFSATDSYPVVSIQGWDMNYDTFTIKKNILITCNFSFTSVQFQLTFIRLLELTLFETD